MEIFKKKSKYSLEDVIKNHTGELSDKIDKAEIKTAQDPTSQQTTSKQIVMKGQTFNVIDCGGEEILANDSVLILRYKRRFDIVILIICIAFAVLTFLTPIPKYPFIGFMHHHGAIPVNYVCCVFTILFFLVWAFSISGMSQKNFDKRLGLFWRGPHLDKEGKIRKSFRCSEVTRLSYLKHILIKEERKQKKDSYIEYCVYLKGLEYVSSSSVFTSYELKDVKHVAGQIAQFLSLTVEEEMLDKKEGV